MATEGFAPITHRQVIEAGKTTGQYWRDLWRYRELVLFLVWRDVSVRYRQTMIGVAWAVIQPLTSMIILTVIFGRLAGMRAPEGVPHAVLTYTGTLPWFYFSSILSGSSGSMVSNTRMITKVYFPRLILPLAPMGVTTVDFLISFSVFGALCGLLGFVPSWRVVFIPFFLVCAALTAYSVGLWLAAMNVRYRDFRFVVPFMIQFGLYISPVAYLSDEVGGSRDIAYGEIAAGSIVIVEGAKNPDTGDFVATSVKMVDAEPARRQGDLIGTVREIRGDMVLNVDSTLVQVTPETEMTARIGVAGGFDMVRFLYCLNPMVTVIDGFRWAVIGSEIDLYVPGVLLSAGIVALLLAGGIWFFRKTERQFADII